ncbi:MULTISPECIES: SDR family oxidoreductase [Nocardia]|uniref:SDR family oxidoreductase n=1 Tax=Nocardia abscessus TaxID=120957 RepID=UPI001895CC1A|nr:SDR family oxidoreductase [Nocardia abscessus]MBF6473730.1 SDR family oxidoreductase [Nocardia abscessus]
MHGSTTHAAVEGLLTGKTAVITGASRGIGLAIAIRFAAEGANVAMIARTQEPHPKLPGTIHTAAARAEAAGGDILPLVADVRDDKAMAAAVEKVVERFGGIDILVNNAGSVDLTGAEQIGMQRYDHMQAVNLRAPFLLSKLALPHLRVSARAGRNPHIVTLSPPLNMNPEWVGNGVAYTVSKYGVSVATIGLAHEFRPYGIAVNSLWPRTKIDTAAVRNLLGGAEAVAASRTAHICADAALLMVTSPAATYTGQLLLDEDVLTASGVTDLDRYRVVPGDGALANDLFVDA